MLMTGEDKTVVKAIVFDSVTGGKAAEKWLRHESVPFSGPIFSLSKKSFYQVYFNSKYQMEQFKAYLDTLDGETYEWK